MHRKPKALGLVLFAAFALSAMTASGASAAGERFHSAADHTILDITQDGAEGVLQVSRSSIRRGVESAAQVWKLARH